MGKYNPTKIILIVLSSLFLAQAAFAQGSIFGNVLNSDGVTHPQPGQLNFFGYVENTDNEIKVESCIGSGYDEGFWFDNFTNYLPPPGAGDRFDYHFFNFTNGEGLTLTGTISNQSIQQEDITLAPVTWPAKPLNLTGGSSTQTTVTITWDAVVGITYHIYRRVYPSEGSFFRIDDPTGDLGNTGISGGQYVDNSVTLNATYDYIIIPQNNGGNFGPHSDIVTVTHLGFSDPVITCPADIVVACGVATDPSQTGQATAVDDDDPSPEITFSDTETPGTCPQEKIITRLWTATDESGNSSQCTQIITVADDIAPVLTCPEDINIPFGSPTDPANTGTAAAVDNCDPTPVVSYTDVTAENVITRTWSAEDACGNILTCAQIITFIDVTPPQITCPADVAVPCTEDWTPHETGEATATDDIDPDPIITNDDVYVEGDCMQEVFLTRTWHATDDAGNTVSCAQVIHITDEVAPSLTCPADIIVPFGSSTAPSVTGTASGMDNCGGPAIVSYTDAISGNIITRTWTGADPCGNTVQCTQTITIEGSADPVITCPVDVIIACGASTEPVNTGIATATDDNDPNPVITYSDEVVAGGCPQEFVITRTWRAEDIDGNVSTCIQNISITDDLSPAITCPEDITIPYGASTEPSATGFATAIDNCDAAPIITFSDIVSGGIITRTWTAADHCGNSGQCIQIITIEGSADPIITCPADITVACDQSSAPDITGTATATDDNDPTPSIIYVDAVAGGACPQEFVITRTWQAEDLDGNISTCLQYITVADDMAPVITCPDNITVPFGSSTAPEVTGFATAIDNCDNAPVITYSDISNAGIISRTWVATDDCGNFQQCTQTIDIQGSGDPEITCPGDLIIACQESTDPSHTGFATAKDDNDPEPMITYSDIITAGGCPQEKIIVRTWVAEDDDGNSSFCDQTITVIDEIGPQITCPGDITVDCASSTLPAVTGSATALDNCDLSPSVTYSDLIQNNVISRTWTASDACGNFSQCLQTITIEDTTPPQISCPSDITIACNEATDPSFTGTATVTDDCSSSITLTYADAVSAGTCPQESTISRTWTASDEFGNENQCLQIITIMDDIAPLTQCPEDITIAFGQSTDPSNTGMATAVDNCDDNPSISYIDAGDEYNITRTWTISDACGNTAQCLQTITILAYAGPVWYVSESGDNNNPGDEEHPFASIKHALNISSAGDTIMVEPGNYTGSDNRNIDFTGKAVTLMSAEGASATIIDCEGTAQDGCRAFIFRNGETGSSILQGFTIRGGYSDSVGAGIFCDGASPRIQECIIENNEAARGGAGLTCRRISTPTIVDCTFRNNVGHIYGGAIYSSLSQPQIVNCVFENNEGGSYGGAVFMAQSAPQIEGCLFVGNQAGSYGGAVAMQYSGGIIENSTFFDNSLINGTSGGGIFYLESANPQISNSILAFSGQGEAVYCYNGSNSPSLSCTDIFGNVGGDWNGCIAAQAGLNGNFSEDPLFCDPDFSNFRLTENSPCAPANNACGELIGALPVGCTPTDIGDEPRAELPSDFRLEQNYPNPFNPATTIAFQLPHRQAVRLEICNLLGQEVAVLIDDILEVGRHEVIWDGRDNSGATVSTGIYFYRLRAGSFSLARKMVLLK